MPGLMKYSTAAQAMTADTRPTTIAVAIVDRELTLLESAMVALRLKR
jgi:hypothetical protein